MKDQLRSPRGRHLRLAIGFTAFIASSALVSACQSEEDGMRALCDAPRTCEECGNAAPEIRASVLARHVDDVVTNSEVSELFDSLAERSPEERVRIVRERASNAGIDHCAIVDVWSEAPP